jgi:hypothetical protein
VHVDEFTGGAMYAVFVEVNADESHLEVARDVLPKTAVPMAREAGAKAGYWLAPQNGRGLSVVIYDTEDQARAVAARAEVGKPPPIPDMPADVTVKTVEVREVIASV